MSERNISDYNHLYNSLPFEDSMVEIRKRVVLDILRKNKPSRILEIGCGNSSIFNDYGDYEQITVIEPSADFFSKLKHDANRFPEKDIFCINDFFSSSLLQSYDIPALDIILISGLLHEIEDPVQMLRDAAALCSEKTIIHINVPNADSIHRLIALETGMLKSVKDKSPLQIKLQQHHTFDMKSLKDIAASCGLQVTDEGSYFIKPFTHAQMQFLLDSPLFGPKIIEGLEKISKYLPQFGTEIFLNLKKK